jgi:hypothetical protein
METAAMIDTLIGIVLAGIGWFVVTISTEVKRLGILLNRTREDYATKLELKGDMDRLLEALHRIEDRLERMASEK